MGSDDVDVGSDDVDVGSDDVDVGSDDGKEVWKYSLFFWKLVNRPTSLLSQLSQV